LPRTDQGDIDRAQLAAPRRQGTKRVAPRTETERRLAAIWQGLLGVGQVGIEDNFFELGGNSLLPAQVLSQVRDHLWVELSIRGVFEAPTIAGVAEDVTRARHSGQHVSVPALVPVARDGDLPLSFAQQRLWFIDQLDPGSSSYNIYTAVRLRGPLQATALQQSL